MKDHDVIQQEYWDSVAPGNLVADRDGWPFPALKERDLFFKFAGFKAGDNVLEIGCGTGRYTLSLLRMGCKVYATDISEKSIEVLRRSAKKENLDKDLIAEQNAFDDIEKCRKFFGKFDYVVFVAVIHHLNPRINRLILANAIKALKKGGRAVALEPNPLNPLYYCLYLWRALARIKGRNRWYTEKDFLNTTVFGLARLFKNAGLERIEIERYAWLPSKFGNFCPFILDVNRLLNRIPVLKEISAFIWIKAEKVG